MTMTDATDTLAEIRSIVEDRKDDARSHETETLCETLLGVLEKAGDAPEPHDTAFASSPWTPVRPDETGYAHVWGSDGELVATVCDGHVESAYERARVIAAAGTAAGKLQDEIDAVEVVESSHALPLAVDAMIEARDYLKWLRSKGRGGVNAHRADKRIDDINDALDAARGG